MDFQSYLNEWRGRRVDFNHKATYLESDLIQEYLFECYGENVQIDTLRSLYEQIPDSITAKFYATHDPVVTEGDIVFIKDFTHCGVATGEQDVDQFEILEQNAVGSQTGIGDDAIRTNYYPKEQICGQLRPRFKPQFVAPVVVQEPETEAITQDLEVPKAVVQKPYKAPTAGLKVPLHLEKLYVKVSLPTYATPIAASSGTKPKDKKLNPGSYETDLVKMGMKRIVTPDKNDETWINPSDNVVKEKIEQLPYIPAPEPKLDGSIEAADNYQDFKDSKTGQLQEKYYTAKASGATVIDFKTGNTRTMPANAHVWLSGITGVGGSGYGIATKCLENPDGTARKQPLWIGISLEGLYEDDTFSKQTTLEERQYLRTLRPSDHIVLYKAKVQKIIKDIL